MLIDKNSPIPVYYQLKEDIKGKISKGIWQVGQCIDSERELSEQYNVSRMTVRQALGELAQEGILHREKGKGTFVCEPKVKQRDIMSFSDMVKKMGLKLTTEVNKFERIHTPDFLLDLLQFEDIYKIDRLRIVEGEVIANEIIYIPCDYCGYVNEERLKYSFYEILKDYGYVIDHSEASMQAVLMDEDYKQIFRTDKVIPLIKSFSKNITSEGKLLFVEESVYRSDKYVLEVNIFRREGKIR
ncbi:GntR family transcriptional regulator [Clostridium sp. YIM B02515]|uniref:GntR family transcriptional regulator n=1 Tax=Clostridium rhizosphaerae TaxID=2803861 RepID=A0ABS1TJE6_9CLOT|nr:GntR family transcriptional regulator [Clostridium rhizosphaerae]MBL4938464.1 GntR family transcriptional regulator [Clostridium rhizosphaerae]